VLRVPRLYREYAALMKEMTDDKKLDTYLKSDLVSMSDEL
jgi:hypothetical protein